MKSTSALLGTAVLALASSLASAQYLDNTQYGSLPDCTDNCPALQQSQSECGTQGWACFCTGVWSQIEAAPQQICAQTCSSATDVTAAYTWYTQNCGSDNGASEHPNGLSNDDSGSSSSGNGNSGSNNDGNSGGSGTSSSSPSSSSSASSSSSSSDDSAPQTWWEGHWRWVVMIIVLFFGLLGLAMLGLWLKKRHYRRRDQITGGFNSGITERAPPMTASNPAMFSNPAVNQDDDAGGRDSPIRTRDAFMPYGYGYARSESRLGSNPDIGRANSPLARGQTPVDTIERGAPAGEEGAAPAKSKSRRVLVRERSGADSSEDVRR